MITAKLLDILTTFLFTVLGILKFPHLPESLINGMYAIFQYVDYSRSIIAFFLPKGVTALLPLFFTIFIGKHMYHFIMWIIKKIPVSID